MNIKKRSIILLLIGTVFWGMTFVFIKEAVEEINVYTFLSFRFLLSAAVLALIFYKKIKSLDIATFIVGVKLSIPLFFAFVAQTVGMIHTTASKGGFISGLSVVIVPLLLSLFAGKLPPLKVGIAVILATTGLCMMTLSGSIDLNIGDVWMLLCALLFAIYIIMVGKYTKTKDTILLVLVQCLGVGIFSLITASISGGLSVPTSYTVWQAILFTSLFATVFTYTVQNYCQKFISEITTSIIFSLEPLFAAVTAYFYLGEILTKYMLFGGIMIFLGIITMEVNFKKIVKSR